MDAMFGSAIIDDKGETRKYLNIFDKKTVGYSVEKMQLPSLANAAQVLGYAAALQQLRERITDPNKHIDTLDDLKNDAAYQKLVELYREGKKMD